MSAVLVVLSILIIGSALAISTGVNAATDSAARSNCAGAESGEVADLDTLQGQLKSTKAVGNMTKLKLRGEINTVLARINAFYAGKSKFSLDQISEQFDLLYMKIVSIVADKDADLHRQLCNSWDSVWESLQSVDGD